MSRQSFSGSESDISLYIALWPQDGGDVKVIQLFLANRIGAFALDFAIFLNINHEQIE